MTTTGIGIQIGPFLLPYYGLMILLGLCAGTVLGCRQCHRFGLSLQESLLICCIGVLCGIVGAKVLYLLVNWGSVDKGRLLDWSYVRHLLETGFVFYGGLFGALGGLAICKRAFKLEVEGVLQVAIPSLPLAHGFGRVGCCLVGCCYGIPHLGFPSITYSSSWFAPNHIGLFPVQAIEALALFLLAGILLLLINRFSSPHGFSIYLISYGAIRFVLEFLRGDAARGFLGPLSTSQWISLVAVVAGVVVVCTLEKRWGPLPSPGHQGKAAPEGPSPIP